MSIEIIRGDALDLITSCVLKPDLIAVDPPYALSGSGDEHALSAAVAIVLREAAAKLRSGGWMLVMAAASWRSQAYMVESVRGILEPVRVATWCKPEAKTKARTPGWAWASVKVIAFRKGKSAGIDPSALLDHITAVPVIRGRRAELPAEVSDWMIAPFAVAEGTMLDPFAGSGALCAAASRRGMHAVGFEKNP